MTSLRLPDVVVADATMEFHVAGPKGIATIYRRGEMMGKYERIDPAAVAARRRADILAGRPLAPNLACHYCDHTVGKGALWCSTGCAQDYTAEREAINAQPPA